MDLKTKCLSSFFAAMLAVVVLGATSVAATPAVTWTASTQPSPPGSTSASLGSIACTGPTDCVALGSATPEGTSVFPYIDTMSGGTSTAIDAPLPSNLDYANGYDNEQLDSIACPATGDCIAVGGAEAVSTSAGVIDQLSNGVWSTMASGTQRLYSLSCASTTFCAAAGFGGALDVFSDGVWTPTAAPGPPNSSDVVIAAVSCGAVGSCVAVGTYRDSPGSPSGGTLIDTYGEGMWSATQGPAISVFGHTGNNYSLNSISCFSAVSCTAVGVVDGGGCSFARCGAGGVALTLTSGRWVPTVSRANFHNFFFSGSPGEDPGLNAVSCWGPGDCAAVGGEGGSGDDTAYVASSENGTWKNAQIALPYGSVSGDGLIRVSCGAANFCVGLGSYATTKAPTQSLAVLAVFNGTSWSETKPALPVDQGVGMSGISCSGSGSGSCTAVGFSSDGPLAISN